MDFLRIANEAATKARERMKCAISFFEKEFAEAQRFQPIPRVH